jgi:hypothetical protein
MTERERTEASPSTPYPDFDESSAIDGEHPDADANADATDRGVLARLRSRVIDRERRSVDRRKFLRDVGVGSGALALASASASADPDPEVTESGTRLDAHTSSVRKPSETRTFPVYDGDGNRTGERTYRTVHETGNCCENYLAADSEGRIFDMGGNFLVMSADDGQTWTRISPSTPYPQTSEGNVSACPNGDVVAVDWNPYSPDRLIAYKYDAADEAWYYNETPLKIPFYDRPWMCVVPGLFTIDGRDVPYVVVQRGGVGADEQLFFSPDGLNYYHTSSRYFDSLLTEGVERYLTDVDGEDGYLDYAQPQTETGIVPLGDASALGTGSVLTTDTPETGCDRTLLTGGPLSEFQWSCFDTPNGLPDGRYLADSRGHLHNVAFLDATTFAYRTSTDGGETWTTREQSLPGNFELADGAVSLFDFKAHGALDVTAIAVHATDTEAAVDQDMVFKYAGAVEGSGDLEVLFVGDADVSYVSGVSTDERFDFCTLAILPDGRVVTSFADLNDSDPMVAVELEGAPDEARLDALGTRSDDGAAFTAGERNTVELVVQATVPVEVRDAVPLAWEVSAGDPAVERVSEAPMQGVQYVYFADTPTEDLRATYEARAPEGADATGEYTFGPLSVRADGGWVAIPDTTDTNAVVGADAGEL